MIQNCVCMIWKAYLDHAYAQNLAKPPLMRICRKFENRCDLFALSGKFLLQKCLQSLSEEERYEVYIQIDKAREKGNYFQSGFIVNMFLREEFVLKMIFLKDTQAIAVTLFSEVFQLSASSRPAGYHQIDLSQPPMNLDEL